MISPLNRFLLIFSKAYFYHNQIPSTLLKRFVKQTEENLSNSAWVRA